MSTNLGAVQELPGYRLLFFALFLIFEEGDIIFFREQFRTAPFLLTTPES